MFSGSYQIHPQVCQNFLTVWHYFTDQRLLKRRLWMPICCLIAPIAGRLIVGIEALVFKRLEFAVTPDDARSGHMYRYPGKGVIDHLRSNHLYISKHNISVSWFNRWPEICPRPAKTAHKTQQTPTRPHSRSAALAVPPCLKSTW